MQMARGACSTHFGSLFGYLNSFTEQGIVFHGIGDSNCLAAPGAPSSALAVAAAARCGPLPIVSSL